MAQLTLADRLQGLTHEIFPQNAEEITGILERECRYETLGIHPGDEIRLAEVQTAVLILSEGSKEKLLRTIEAAKADWRDVLLWSATEIRKRGLFRP